MSGGFWVPRYIIRGGGWYVTLRAPEIDGISNDHANFRFRIFGFRLVRRAS